MYTRATIAQQGDPRSATFDLTSLMEPPITIEERRPVYFLDTYNMRQLWDYDSCPRPIIGIGVVGRNDGGFIEVYRLTRRDYRLYDGVSVYKMPKETDWYKNPCPKEKDFAAKNRAYDALFQSHITYAPEHAAAMAAYAQRFGDYAALCDSYDKGYLWHSYLKLSFTTDYSDNKATKIRFIRELRDCKDSKQVLTRNYVSTDANEVFTEGIALLGEWESRRQRVHELDWQIEIDGILQRIPLKHKDVCENLLKTLSAPKGAALRYYQGQLLYQESDWQRWQVIYDTKE